MNLSFLGDIYLNNSVKIAGSIHLHNVILNLEAPFSDKGVPGMNKVNLSMDPDVVFSTFNPAHIAAVNLANNHIMDYGEEAYNTTIELLKAKNIPFFGAGKSTENFNNPFIIGNVAIFGYACTTTNAIFGDGNKSGAAVFNTDHVIKEIQKYRTSYFIVVNLHWGQEYYSFPKPEDVYKARKLIDNGVDMIIGHHPHKLQSFEKYKGKYIFYSLGNGIFHNGIVPSKFDGYEFRSFYNMKYKKSCRYSYLVNLDTETKKIVKEMIYYDQKKLVKKRSFLQILHSRIILNRFFYRIYSKYENIILAIDYRLKKYRS